MLDLGFLASCEIQENPRARKTYFLSIFQAMIARFYQDWLHTYRRLRRLERRLKDGIGQLRKAAEMCKELRHRKDGAGKVSLLAFGAPRLRDSLVTMLSFRNVVARSPFAWLLPRPEVEPSEVDIQVHDKGKDVRGEVCHQKWFPPIRSWTIPRVEVQAPLYDLPKLFVSR